MKPKTENGKPITVKLFSVPISIIHESQALALIGEWVREYRSVISSRLSVVGSKSAGSQSAGFKPIDRKLTNRKPKTENRKPITGYPKIIVTPNPEIIVAAQSDPELMKALQEADLSVPDGIGVIWALRLLGPKAKGQGPKESAPVSPLSLSPYPLSLSPISGIDLMESLILQPQKVSPFEPKLKIMLLGGRPGMAQKAAENLWRLKRPGLAPQGRAFIKSISGPQNLAAASPDELNELINSINSFQPDLLFVAFGHPKQEKWLSANRRRLNVGVAMAVGGALDQIADPSLRPPAYINSIGLGWLYRLLRQPWRWKRQLALVKFAGMVVRQMKNLK